MFRIDQPGLQSFAYIGFHCDRSVTRGVMMPERAKLTSLSENRRMQAIQRELAAFEKQENDLNARERKERAARLVQFSHCVTLIAAVNECPVAQCN